MPANQRLPMITSMAKASSAPDRPRRRPASDGFRVPRGAGSKPPPQLLDVHTPLSLAGSINPAINFAVAKLAGPPPPESTRDTTYATNPLTAGDPIHSLAVSLPQLRPNIPVGCNRGQLDPVQDSFGEGHNPEPPATARRLVVPVPDKTVWDRTRPALVAESKVHPLLPPTASAQSNRLRSHTAKYLAMTQPDLGTTKASQTRPLTTKLRSLRPDEYRSAPRPPWARSKKTPTLARWRALLSYSLRILSFQSRQDCLVSWLGEPLSATPTSHSPWATHVLVKILWFRMYARMLPSSGM